MRSKPARSADAAGVGAVLEELGLANRRTKRFDAELARTHLLLERVDPRRQRPDLLEQHPREGDDMGRRRAFHAIGGRGEPAVMRRPRWRDHPMLGEMAAQGVDGLDFLAHERVLRLERGLRGLRLDALHRDEAHRGAGGGAGRSPRGQRGRSSAARRRAAMRGFGARGLDHGCVGGLCSCRGSQVRARSDRVRRPRTRPSSNAVADPGRLRRDPAFGGPGSGGAFSTLALGVEAMPLVGPSARLCQGRSNPDG